MDRQRIIKGLLLSVVSSFVLLTFVISVAAEINTVLGPISPDKLGTTLMEEGAPAYFTSLRWGTDTSKMISEIMIKEITQGIGKTGVRAGVIKVGSSPKMTPHEQAVHRAAAIAQKATGVPIITHTQGPTGGVEQAEFLLKEGADFKKVMIGHVSNSQDIEYHKAILAKGVYIAFDRIGLDIITPFDVNAKNVAGLCKLGFANKIMLSHDTVNVWLGRLTEPPKDYLAGFKNGTLITYPRISFLHSRPRA